MWFDYPHAINFNLKKMILSTQNLPSYTENLERGHSYDCKTLEVTHYPDLHSGIRDTADRVRDGLYTLMDTDVDFADRARGILEHLGLNGTNYQGLLCTLSHIQSLLRASKLSEDERIAFWTPIAQCYARVQATLKERILPLEQRELIKMGETVRVPVQVRRFHGRIMLSAELPAFRYALELTNRSNPSNRYRDDLHYISFRYDYVSGLPREVKDRLEKGTMELPIKVVYAERSMLTIAEIDVPAFLGEQAE